MEITDITTLERRISELIGTNDISHNRQFGQPNLEATQCIKSKGFPKIMLPLGCSTVHTKYST